MIKINATGSVADCITKSKIPFGRICKYFVFEVLQALDLHDALEAPVQAKMLMCFLTVVVTVAILLYQIFLFLSDFSFCHVIFTS